jgi:hypothetical protein
MDQGSAGEAEVMRESKFRRVSRAQVLAWSGGVKCLGDQKEKADFPNIIFHFSFFIARKVHLRSEV